MAGKKLEKKAFKLVKKASEAKCLKRGVKEVIKSVRKGAKGVCFLAGDISPLDVISHIPVFMEENDIPYVFVRSKSELGAAARTKRPTSCVLVVDREGVPYARKLEEVSTEMKELQPKP